jgi:hypothetical protein
MGGETEILDVVPIDLLHSMSKKWIEDLQTMVPVPDAMRAQALDIEFHWVNETGETGRLTSNVTVKITVRPCY